MCLCVNMHINCIFKMAGLEILQQNRISFRGRDDLTPVFPNLLLLPWEK